MLFELTVGEFIVYISIIYGRGFLYPVWEKYQSIRVKLKYQSMIQTVMGPTVTCVVGFLKHKNVHQSLLLYIIHIRNWEL